ncbi:MAG: tRNA (cytidine(56)-2'-O)-methyltransferase [Candidatus Odinarchaeia archaeon]
MFNLKKMLEMVIGVIRLNHRIKRDKRITSHVFLAARALGADFGIFSGEYDTKLLDSIKDVVERWGGEFKISYSENIIKEIEKFKRNNFKLVHLTVYGIPLKDRIAELRKTKDIIVIVGGSKVPRKIYDISDYNISVGTQPHSEISSLAIFLHEYFMGKELNKKFEGYKLKVIPQEHGKKVINLED